MAKQELLASIRDRYRESSRQDKSKILDEFIAVTGHHRKHGIRLLARSSEGSYGTGAVKGRRIYDDAVRDVVVLIWEASDRICGKRLKAAMPPLVESMERYAHLDLDPEVTTRVLSASAATLDRLLKPVKSTVIGRRKRRRRLSPGRNIPVRTFADWNRPPPGFLENDLVAHCGDSMWGSFIYSLVDTDVCTGWTEAVPLLAREQNLVVAALGSHRQTIALSRARHRLRQRQRVHQRHPHRVLRRPGHRVHPFPSVPQERSSVGGAKERSGDPAFPGP